MIPSSSIHTFFQHGCAVICTLNCVSINAHLSFLQPGSSTILKYFGSDVIPRVLEVHDGVRDFEADGNDDSFNVEGTEQTVRQDLEVICRKKLRRPLV